MFIILLFLLCNSFTITLQKKDEKHMRNGFFIGGYD